MSFELFTRTIDNRFVFHLFEFLLSGVIALVILKAWRNRSGSTFFANQWCLLLAGALLSLSLGYAVLWTGARFFFQTGIAELPILLASHICLAGAWMLIGLQFLPGTVASPSRCGVLGFSLMGLSLCPILLASCTSDTGALFERSATGLDCIGLVVLATTIYLILRSAILARRILTASMCLFWLAGVLHLGSREVVSFPVPASELLFWNLEQILFSAALLLLALAIGEMSTDLFDIVFIRIQIAFILLASLIILVITSTERSEYLMELRGRSQNLAAFVVARVESSAARGQPLSRALDREDLLARITMDFGNLPELAAVHILAGDQAAAFTINSKGEIRKTLSLISSDSPSREFLNQDRCFLIGSFPLKWNPQAYGTVQLYGTKEYLDRYTRKRTVLIFSLFTAAVALATLMIGLVVHHAQRTLRRQEEEIQAKQEELLMASKLAVLGELAGSVAHEVNNPATTIMSRASFLLKRWKSKGLPGEEREDLGAILEQAQRIAHITASLLGFSRKYVFEIHPVSICEVIEKSISLVQDDLKVRSIEVTVQGCPSPTLVSGDRNSLVEVFVNLLRNSIDAMPGGGNVCIEVSPCGADQSSLRIRFSDAGMGIAEEHLSRVFLPFFTTKRVGKGTGLGLSVVYGIISEHKGSIRVDSRKGEGTTFYIELPCKESK